MTKKSNKAKEPKVIIDVDEAIKVYNENQKNEKDHIDRYALSEELEVSYQTFINYKNGRVPNVVSDIKKIIDKTGIEFNKLVKFKNQ